MTIVNGEEEAKSQESGIKKNSSVRRGASPAGRLHCRSHRNWVEKRKVSVRLAGLLVVGESETSFGANTGHMQQTCAHNTGHMQQTCAHNTLHMQQTCAQKEVI